ncbi:MAG: hypothetical protein SPL08_00410 [Pseudomonadota bacterium]|nr:hypothetical protein [Pseudomonadota bacterium]
MVRHHEEQSVPVQELETQTGVSIQRFGRPILVFFLSVVCVLIGFLIYNLSAPTNQFRDSSQKQTVNVPPKKNVRGTSVVFQKSSTPPLKQKSVATESTPTVPMVHQISVPPISPPETVQATMPPKVSQPMIESVPPLTLSDALSLRDHLQRGDLCLADLKQIMKKNPPFPYDKDRLIEKLMPVCTARSVFQDMENTFYENRGKALMAYYRMNNPVWLAYIKTVGTRLVDIRQLNPSQSGPRDIISLAQNQLRTKNVAATIQQIQKLPLPIRDAFNAFVEMAKTYMDAQKEVESLILSFDRKGI